MTKRSSVIKLETCFVSAGGNVDLRPIREILVDENVRLMSPDPASSSFRSFDAVAFAIREADFVIGILTKEPGDANVLFELGFACGIGKSLLIVGPESIDIPTDLSGFLFVPNGLSNPSGLRFNIEQLIASGGKTAPSRRGSTPKADTAAKSEVARSSAQYHSQLEEYVAQIFLKGGAEFVTPSPTADQGVDLAIWIDEIASLTGGPLLVEVKSRLDQPQATSDSVSAFLDRSSARFALVVYREGPDPESLNRTLATPFVYFYRVDELAADVRKSSAAEVIRRLRNRMVHGA